MAKILFALLFLSGTLCAQEPEGIICAWKMAAVQANASYFLRAGGDVYEKFPISPLGDRVGNQISAPVPTLVVELWAGELGIAARSGDQNLLRELAQFAIAQRWRVGTVVPLDITQPRLAFYAGLFRAWYKEAEVKAALRQYEAEFQSKWGVFQTEAIAAIRRGESPSVHFSAPYTYGWLRPDREMLRAFLNGVRLSKLEGELRAEVESTFRK